MGKHLGTLETTRGGGPPGGAHGGFQSFPVPKKMVTVAESRMLLYQCRGTRQSVTCPSFIVSEAIRHTTVNLSLSLQDIFTVVCKGGLGPPA